jgi:predicted MFS family arabinose efflux permease
MDGRLLLSGRTKIAMNLRRNLTLGCVSGFFTMFLVIVPILVPFWKTLGLSIQETLEIQAIFGLAVALFEIPTGYIADLWSRKASVCLGTFIAGCGFSCIPFCTTYESIVMYEVIIALGGSLVSGADISIVYDSIKDDPNRLKHVGSLSTWSLLGEAVAGLLASILIFWSFTPILWAQVVVGWVPFFVSLWFIEPPSERVAHTSHFSNFKTVLKHLLLGETITRQIFINSLIWGLSSFCVVWLLQPYWELQRVPLQYFGVMWAALMFVAAGTSKATHTLERRVGAPTILISLSLAAVVGYLLMAFFGGWIGVVAGALFYVNRGLASVIFTDSLNWKIPSAFRATANSMRSFGFRMSYAAIGPATGFLVDTRGLNVTFGVLGAIAAVLFVVTLLPLSRRMHELHVDYIAPE